MFAQTLETRDNHQTVIKQLIEGLLSSHKSFMKFPFKANICTKNAAKNEGGEKTEQTSISVPGQTLLRQLAKQLQHMKIARTRNDTRRRTIGLEKTTEETQEKTQRRNHNFGKLTPEPQLQLIFDGYMVGWVLFFFGFGYANSLMPKHVHVPCASLNT